MTTEVLIHGELREKFGTGSARDLRRRGFVPGVIYGKNSDVMHVTLPAKKVNALANTFELKTRVVELEVNNKKHRVLPRDVNFHPVSDDVEHIDFMFLNDKETIKVDVPIYYSNADKSIGIKRGGALNAVFRSVKVRAKASAVPEYLEIDLTGTVVGNVIRFRDIKFPEGVEPVGKSMDITVAKIVGKRSLELELAELKPVEEESAEGVKEESAEQEKSE